MINLHEQNNSKENNKYCRYSLVRQTFYYKSMKHMEYINTYVQNIRNVLDIQYRCHFLSFSSDMFCNYWIFPFSLRWGF